MGLRLMPKAPRSLSVFGLVLLVLFLVRFYWIGLPLSRELTCGTCLAWLLVRTDWPMFAVMLVLFAASLTCARVLLGNLMRLLVLVIGLFYVADIYVYHEFYVRLDFRDVAVYGEQVRLVWGQFVQSLSWPTRIGFALIALITLAVSLRWRTHSQPADYRILRGPLLLLAAGIAVNVTHSDTFPSTWIVRNVFAHNLRTGVSVPYDPEHVTRLASDLAARAPQCLAGSDQHPNIIVLIAESWSPYHSKLFSGLHDWTPRLDAWASRGRYFTNLHAAGSNTNAGLISILLGHDMYSPLQNVLRLRPFQDLWGLPSSLPKAMAANGMQTVFMTNGNLAFSGKGDWLHDIGFEQVHGHDAPEYAGRPRLSFDAAADEYLYQKAIGFVAEKHDRPYLLVLENVSSHHPYTHPHTLERNERKAFAYMDQSMDAFLRRLDQMGFLRDNLLVVISDHRAMTQISPAEIGRFGAEAGARIPGFVLSGLVEAGEVAVPLHQADLLPSLVAFTSAGACARRPVVDMLHDSPASDRCLYFVSFADWHAVHAFCPQGAATVRLSGSRSRVVAPGLGSETADAELLDTIALRRTTLSVYDVNGKVSVPPALAWTPPKVPAVPTHGVTVHARADTELTPTTIDIASLPKRTGCNIEFLNAMGLDGKAVAIEPYSDYVIEGWVIDEQQHDIAPSVQLLIKAGDTDRSWLVGELLRKERPDVVAYRQGDTAYARAGFRAVIPTDALHAGAYELALVYRSDTELVRCGLRQFRILTPGAMPPVAP